MNDPFWAVVFGHLAGDYFFQSKTMALRKSQKDFRGFLWCVFHCLCYTLCVLIFTQRFSLVLFSLVFFTHYPIDRYSLASWWLRMIKGRDLLKAYGEREKYWEIDVAFSAIVYTIVDNSMHLVLLWFVFERFI